MDEIKNLTLRCDDDMEAVVLRRYGHKRGDINYEFSIEDTYIGRNYRGFIGKLKRAWHAFKADPVVYTGVWIDNPKRIRKFLADALELVNEYAELETEE